MQTKGQFPLLVKAEAHGFSKMERKKNEDCVVVFQLKLRQNRQSSIIPSQSSPDTHALLSKNSTDLFQIL
jgi:hypothetical protein